MRCILRAETDPYFNIAAEEYLFKNSTEDTFMLWRNDPSVIIGKHQNAFAEVNHEFVSSNNIPVIRRISGGGTVYHDHGNLNFTFIAHVRGQNLVDFNRFTTPMVEALNSMGLKVAVGPRNSMYIDGKKISGNAEHVYKDKVLHHGTLLFNSDLNLLEESIRPPKIRYKDKAVKSIRATVTNISSFMPETRTIQHFAELLMHEITSHNVDAYFQNLKTSEIIEINKLKDSRYTKWEWNYGYSPDFCFDTTLSYKGIDCPVNVSVKAGIINELTINDNNYAPAEILHIINDVKGARLDESELRNKLHEHYSDDTITRLLHAMLSAGTPEHLHNRNVVI